MCCMLEFLWSIHKVLCTYKIKLKKEEEKSCILVWNKQFHYVALFVVESTFALLMIKEESKNLQLRTKQIKIRKNFLSSVHLYFIHFRRRKYRYRRVTIHKVWFPCSLLSWWKILFSLFMLRFDSYFRVYSIWSFNSI